MIARVRVCPQRRARRRSHQPKLGIGPLNREIFNRAVEIGDHIDAREWAMFMILVARAVERIADNAVEIAEQTVFVVTGLFREFTDAPQLAGKQAAGSD